MKSLKISQIQFQAQSTPQENCHQLFNYYKKTLKFKPDLICTPECSNIITNDNGTFLYSTTGGGYINIFDEEQELESTNLTTALSNLSLSLTYPIDGSTNIYINELKKTDHYGLVAVIDDSYEKKYHIIKKELL